MAPHGTASRGLSPSSRDRDTVVGACIEYAPIGSGRAPPEWPAGRPREVPGGLARWTSSGFGPGTGIGRSIAGVPGRGLILALGADAPTGRGPPPGHQHLDRESSPLLSGAVRRV